MTADDYLKKVQAKSRVSVLEPYKDDLLKLRKAGLSYNQLLDFLRENKVNVAYATFSLWMRRHMPAEVLPPPKSQPKKSSTSEAPPTNQAALMASTPTQTAPEYINKKRKPEVKLDFMKKKE